MSLGGVELDHAERVGNHVITGNIFLVFPIPDTVVTVPDLAQPVYLTGKAILVPSAPAIDVTMELAIAVANQVSVPLDQVLDASHGPGLQAGDGIVSWVRLPPNSPGQYQLYATVTDGDITVLSPDHATAKLSAIAYSTPAVVGAVNAYVSRAEVKRWLGLDEPSEPHALDPLIDTAIDATSRWIDARCRRHFFQVVEARRFAATSAYEIQFGHFNDLVSVTALRTDEDGDGIYETTWAPEDFVLRPTRHTSAPELKPFRMVQAIGRTFPRANAPGQRCELVEIDGVWGWPAIPTPVTQAAEIQVARIVKRKEAPEGIIGLSQFGAIRVSGKPDPDVSAQLGGYRLRAVG